MEPSQTEGLLDKWQDAGKAFTIEVNKAAPKRVKRKLYSKFVITILENALGL